jgi:tetratricopeptide (TPR) repeat protein
LNELSIRDVDNSFEYQALQSYLLANQGKLTEAFVLVKPIINSNTVQLTADAIEKLSNCAYELAQRGTLETDEQARHIYLFCVKQKPDHPIYNYMAAYLLYKKDTPEAYAQALPYAEKAAQQEPNDYNYAITYANLLVENKRYEEAAAIYKKIPHQHPQYAYAGYFNLAEMYYDLKKPAKAWEWIQKAYESKPDLEVIVEMYQELKKNSSQIES